MRGGCPDLRGGHPQHLLPLAILPGSHRHELILSRNIYMSKCFLGRTDFNHGLLGSLPGISVSEEHSAHSIREALQRREATCIISLPAKLLIHAEALLPEATRTLMQMTNKVLQKSARGPSGVPGKSLNPRFGVLFQAITSLGKFAARALN